MIQEHYPYLSKYEEIGGYAYTTTYLISAGDEWANVHVYNYDRSGEIGADYFELGCNVLLTQKGPGVWLPKQDEDYVVVKLGGLALDIKSAQYADGTNIQLYAANGTDAQRWKIVKNEDGTSCLLAKDERFAMAHGSDGNIYLAEYRKDEKSQKWWITD